MHTFRFVQLASFIWASCEAGVSDWVLPNGDVIMVVTARFSLDGVLLNEKARPTCKRNKKEIPITITTNLTTLAPIFLPASSSSWQT